MKSNRRKFHYRQRTPESVERQIRRVAETRAIRRGDVPTLCDMLREEGHFQLADFIAGGSFPKRLGQALVIDWTDGRDVCKLIGSIVRGRAALIREQTGRSLKHGDYPRLINDVMCQLAEDGQLDKLGPPNESDVQTKDRREILGYQVLKDIHQGRNYRRQRARDRS
jgi:hypothetical protein